MNHQGQHEHQCSPGDAPPTLAADDIHCWVFSLDEAADEAFLDANEQARAAKFHFDRDRRRFIAGHNKIRRILGQYQETKPHALAFSIGANGRPSLNGGGVNFNYSRADEWGLLAVSTATNLGADIEAVRMSDDWANVAAAHFSAAEQSALAALSGAAWTDAFFNGWTRKEAVVKAMGVGLSASLSSFDVSIAPGERPKILRAVGDCVVARDWALCAFNPLDGYRAAIATDLTAPNLHVLREIP